MSHDGDLGIYHIYVRAVRLGLVLGHVIEESFRGSQSPVFSASVTHLPFLERFTFLRVFEGKKNTSKGQKRKETPSSGFEPLTS